MKITTPYGTLRLGDETNIPFEKINPLLNEQGSHSLPFTIPWTQENLKSLNNPDKHTNCNFEIDSIEAFAEFNESQERGTLSIVELKKNESIELAFIIDNGGFWEWAKATNLRDIDIPYQDGEIDISIENFNTTLQSYIDSIWPDVDFAFFPIADQLISLDNYEQTEYYNSWCARKLCISDYTIWNNPGDLFRNDGEDRTGLITPFVYLNAAINWIAATFGCKIGYNFLASTDELKSAVILNRDYNTNLLGDYYITFNRLLPNVDIIDFIDSVEGIFGCRFFVNSNTKTITIKSVKELITSTPIPITGNITVNEVINSRSLNFSAGKITSPYISIENRAINNYLFSYETQNGPITDGKVYATAGTPDYITYPNQVVFSVALQAYFYFEWVENSPNWDYTATCIHSHFYDTKIDETKESFDVKPTAKLLPMIPVTCRQFFINGSEENDYFDFTLIIPHFNQWDWLLKNENGVLGLDFQETPISFAFNRGRVVNVDFGITLFGMTNYDLPWGSVDVYDKDGVKIVNADIALRFADDDSIYENFYEEFEFLLNNCNVRLDLTNFITKEIFEKNIYDTLLADGIKFFIDKMQYSLTPFKTEINSIEAISLKPFIDRVAPDPTNIYKYGFLYNHWVAASEKLIPLAMVEQGWRVQSDSDATALTDYIQDEITAERLPDVGIGCILKSERTEIGDPSVGIPTNDHPRWDYHSSNYGRDSLGFNGHAAGFRYIDGTFYYVGIFGYLWCSTEIDSSYAWFSYLNSALSDAYTSFDDKKGGYSIRCVRDATSEEKANLSDGDTTNPFIGNNGKVYRAIYVGKNGAGNGQVWMIGNLAETKLNDDTWIKGYDDGVYTTIGNEEWAALDGEPALCAYEDDLSYVW